MADSRIENLRTFSIAGHGQCGKTTIADTILFKAGVVNRCGNVKDGTSVSDFTEEEKHRQISISSGVLNCVHKGKSFNIIDTPGYMDFYGDTIASFCAVDCMVLVVDANGGVQVITRKSWEYAEKNNIPVLIVVNKVDGENIDIPEIISKLHSSLSSKAVPVNYPDGTGAEFTKVFNLLDKSVELDGKVADMQNELIESIVENDEELLEKYLEDEKVEMSELIDLLKKAIVSKSLVPVMFTSGGKELGVEELMDFIADFGISPLDTASKPLYKGEGEEETEEEYTVDSDQPFRGRVFKVLTDPYVGKLCFIRVLSGIAKEGIKVSFRKGEKPVALTQLMKVQGGKQEPVSEAVAGDIVAVAKIDGFELGDTLLDGKSDFHFALIDFPEPMVSMAIFAKSRGDEQKVAETLRTFAKEDALMTIGVNRETQELVMSGMGALHLESILSRMKKQFGLEVETKLPKIAYKETVMGNADVSYKHKKQTGGHGQYGEVHIKLAPLDRGGGFEFVNAITGGVIPNQYIPAVEKGVIEAMADGLYAGFPIVDVRVELYYGSYHDVDSSEMSFKTAARNAFKDGFFKSKPVLLEPINRIEIQIPAGEMGNITGDLTSRRGRMEGLDTFGDMMVIKAIVPESEIQSYSTELRSATGGEGTFSKTFSHYDVVPGNIAEKVIAKYKKVDKEDE